MQLKTKFGGQCCLPCFYRKEALKTEFARVKCHGSVPELSYSPEPSSPIYISLLQKLLG